MRSVLIASAAFAVAAPKSVAIKTAYFTDPSGVRVELTGGLDQY